MRAILLVSDGSKIEHPKLKEETLEQFYERIYKAKEICIKNASGSLTESASCCVLISGMRKGIKYLAASVEDLLTSGVFESCSGHPFPYACTLEDNTAHFAESIEAAIIKAVDYKLGEVR